MATYQELHSLIEKKTLTFSDILKIQEGDETIGKSCFIKPLVPKVEKVLQRKANKVIINPSIKEEILTEKQDKLYHYTDIHSAHSILNDGKFRLSSAIGTGSEIAAGNKNHPFYLSTTRSKAGEYHKSAKYNHAVMFNLNGQHLSQNNKVKPTNYWHTPGATRSSDQKFGNEMEERVFSNKQHIPIPKKATKLIHSVHIFYNKESAKDKQFGPQNNEKIRQTIISAKKRNIPVHVYDDVNHWRNQDTRNSVSPSSLNLKGSGDYSTRINRKWLSPYKELYHAPPGQVKSKKARDILYNLKYRSYSDDTTRGFEADLHNQKKSKEIGSIAPLVQKHGGAKGFLDYIKKKHKVDENVSGMPIAKIPAVEKKKNDQSLAFNDPYGVINDPKSSIVLRDLAYQIIKARLD